MNSNTLLTIIISNILLLPQLLSYELTGHLLKIQSGTVLLLIGLYALHQWRTRIAVTPEPEVKRTYGKFVGEPRFDPYAGIVASVLIDGNTHDVVITPNWWQYFAGSKLNQNRQETVVSESPVSSVPMGREPKSLVCIQREDGVVIGMGSRVKVGSGTVLLTCFHVVKKPQTLYLCKNGVRVAIDRAWEAEAWCSDPEMDLMSIRVPEKVWSTLGVSAAMLTSLSGGCPVTVYGAESSSKFLASTGMASVSKGLTARHYCTTLPSWSGSPVYYKGSVVAMHRGFHEQGVSNNATIVLPILSKAETMYDDGRVREVDMDEIELRPDVLTYEVGGRGKLYVGDSEYAKFYGARENDNWKSSYGRNWSDAIDDEDWEYYDTMETLESEKTGKPEEGMPLNCQEAVSECSLPSETLASTSGVIQLPSIAKECHSSMWESRVCVLEKLIEQQIALSSKLLEEVSRNSKTLAGLSAERLRSSTPSCTKPADSREPTPPTISGKVLIGSLPVTLKPDHAESSETKPGRKRRSRKRSKQSVKGKSTDKPAQASH